MPGPRRAAFVLCVLMACWPAQAAVPERPVEPPVVIEAVGATQVADILRALNYRAELAQERSGDPVVLAEALPREDEAQEDDPAVGLRFAVLFYDCEGSAQAEARRCGSLVLHASFAMVGDAHTIRDINEWDRLTRYSRAYFDRQGHPVLERDIVLSGGVTLEWLSRRLGEWRRGLGGFAERLDYSAPTSDGETGALESVPGLPSGPPDGEPSDGDEKAEPGAD